MLDFGAPQAVIKEEAEKYLMQVDGWRLAGNALEKTFRFVDFKQAISFVNKVAEIAESENHHPDILLWNWNNVKLTITTHTIGGLSKNDFSLAAKIDKIKLQNGS